MRQAELEVEIAEAARDGVEQASAAPRRGAHGRRPAPRPRSATPTRWSARPARRSRARSDVAPLLELVEVADDIADCVEEAAFYTTLLRRRRRAGECALTSERIAGIVLAAAREYLRAVS